jgi:hypothetical protein
MEKLSYTLLVSDEDIVDGYAMRQWVRLSLGLPDEPLTALEAVVKDAAAARLRVKEVERERYWTSLPLRVRVARVLRGEWHSRTDRLARAIRAFRAEYRDR